MSSEIAENTASKNTIDAYIKALQNSFNYKGRTSRYDYWGFHFINFVVIVCLFILSAFLSQNSESSAKNVLIFINIYQVALLVPSLSAWVRRFHDTNKSALKWILLPIIICLIFFGVAGASLVNTSLDKSLYFFTASLLFIITTVTWFVILCRRGSAADNKYGPAIVEDASQRWKGLFIPIIMVILPFLLAFSLGIVAGYGRAMNKYKAEKIASVIYSLLADAKGANSQVLTVDDDLSGHDHAVPTGLFYTDPFGAKIEIKRSEGRYVIKRSNISFSLCMALSEYKWKENPDFVGIGINGGKDCLSCTDAETCTIDWIYK